MPDYLALHETLELHELVAFQSNALMDVKMSIKKVQDPELRKLYVLTIRTLETNLKELIPFYNFAPARSEETRNSDPFYAGQLLGMSKTAVKSYAAAITETATPQLLKVFTRQLNGAIEWHYEIFEYMLKNDQYPAYDLKKLLQNDLNQAAKAIEMKY